MSNILIVDDESIVTMHLEEMLTKMGYGIAGTAYSVDEAIAKAEELSPDLVLMDIVMQDRSRDGIDAAEVIRSKHDIPIVFLTAYADDEFVERAKSAQPYGFIVKPFQDRELRAVIELAMAKRKLEQKLRRSEKRLNTLIENLPVAVYMKDLSGRYQIVNRKFEESFNVKRAQVLGRTAGTVFPSKQAARYDAEDRSVLENGDQLHFEENVLVQGVSRAFSGIKFPLVGDKGQPYALCCVETDVTEKKCVEDALRESEEEYRALFDHSPDAIGLLSPQGTVLDCNLVTQKLTGHNSDELIGLHFAKTGLIPPGKGDEYLELFQGILESGHSQDTEITVLDARGETLWFDLNTAPLYKDGQLFALQVRGRDITARKQLEERNRSMQERLLQLQKMESLGTLAGGLAHDLNNMLAVILGNANLALMDLGEGQTYHEEFKEIEDASLRARELIAQMLTFAQYHKPVSEPLAIAEVVEDLLVVIKRNSTSGIELTSDLGCSGRVMADKSQLLQALVNIGTNAIDAMPGGGSLHITLGSFNGRGTRPTGITCLEGRPGCFIQFNDSGAGISEAIRNRVFDPFFSTKGFGAGAGLGLSTAIGIVRNHDGDILLDSVQGQGTTVTVCLPLCEADSLRNEDAEHDGNKQDAENPKETILLVDDEQPVLHMTRRVLENDGYTVLAADCGKEALEIFILHRHNIAAVVLDILMPGMDGFELLEAIRAVSPDVKAVMCSGYNLDEHQKKIKEMRVSAFVQKPFEISHLQSTLRSALDTQIP